MNKNAYLKIETNDDGCTVSMSGSATDIATMLMRAVNSVYKGVKEESPDGARMIQEIFHDELMVDALFTETDKDRCEIMNRMNARILEKMFELFAGSDGDSDDEGE